MKQREDNRPNDISAKSGVSEALYEWLYISWVVLKSPTRMDPNKPSQRSQA